MENALDFKWQTLHIIPRGASNLLKINLCLFPPPPPTSNWFLQCVKQLFWYTDFVHDFPDLKIIWNLEFCSSAPHYLSSSSICCLYIAYLYMAQDCFSSLNSVQEKDEITDFPTLNIWKKVLFISTECYLFIIFPPSKYDGLSTCDTHFLFIFISCVSGSHENTLILFHGPEIW